MRILFGLIVLAGLIGALLAGGGKHVKVPPAGNDLALTASVDGKPVQIGGPGIALIEQRLSATNANNRATPKARPVP